MIFLPRRSRVAIFSVGEVLCEVGGFGVNDVLANDARRRFCGWSRLGRRVRMIVSTSGSSGI